MQGRTQQILLKVMEWEKKKNDSCALFKDENHKAITTTKVVCMGQGDM